MRRAASVAPVEQALIFASIIVGVAVSDQIVSLNRLLRADSPVRWHWALPATALLVLMTNLQVWWSIAGDKSEGISIGAFLPNLVELIIIALLSAASLPDKVEEEGIDLKQYYDRNAGYIWTLFVLTLAWAELIAFTTAIREDQSILDFASNRLIDFVAIGVMIALAFVRRRWLVASGIAFLFLGPLSWLSRTVQ